MQTLTLGTVQFGLDYGIMNHNGQPSVDYSVEVLKQAYDAGIRSFDTANAYGTAEVVFGEFVKRHNIHDFEITSKFRPNILDEKSPLSINDLVKYELNGSCKKMNVDHLFGYLLHTPEYVYNEDILNGLQAAKEAGLVKEVGVSIYNEPEALHAVKNPKVDYIQVPYSIFDQRLHATDFFELAEKNNKRIYARSAFVQGLIFATPDNIPERVKESKSYIEKLIGISKELNRSIAELSILFTKANTAVDSLVFGVDTKEQLAEDIEIFNNKNLNKDEVELLRKEFASVEKYVMIPSLWKK